MGNRVGHSFLGSSSLQTSIANQELVPIAPEDWINSHLSFYKFSFDNDQECTIKVNGGNLLFLKAGQGFESTEVDAPIHSFIVVTAGVTFNWIGAY